MSDIPDYEYEHTMEPHCPHCGYKFMDTWEWPNSSQDDECNSCGEKFSYETESVRYFTLTPIKPKEPR